MKTISFVLGLALMVIVSLILGQCGASAIPDSTLAQGLPELHSVHKDGVTCYFIYGLNDLECDFR